MNRGIPDVIQFGLYGLAPTGQGPGGTSREGVSEPHKPKVCDVLGQTAQPEIDAISYSTLCALA